MGIMLLFACGRLRPENKVKVIVIPSFFYRYPYFLHVYKYGKQAYHKDDYNGARIVSKACALRDAVRLRTLCRFVTNYGFSVVSPEA